MMHGLFLLLTMFLAPLPSSAVPEEVDTCLERLPYTVGTYNEKAVEIVRDGVVLKGRLLLPNRPGAHPGVVIIPGGGRSVLLNHTPRYIASRLARCGIAVLVYEKRGTGRSGGVWAETTFDDLIEDAHEAVSFLRAHPDVRPRQVGLVGISQGGRLAPVVAARYGGVAFLVSVSAPFTPVRETRLFALKRLFHERGYDEVWEDKLFRLWEDFLKRLEEGGSTADLDERIHSLSNFPSALLPPLSTDAIDGPLYHALGKDYTTEFQGLDLPFFALYGAEDQIVPVAPSLALLQKTLGPRLRLELAIVPEVDHSFNYTDPHRERFRFEEVVALWIMGQVGLVEQCSMEADLVRSSSSLLRPEFTVFLANRPCTTHASGG